MNSCFLPELELRRLEIMTTSGNIIAATACSLIMNDRSADVSIT